MTEEEEFKDLLGALSGSAPFGRGKDLHALAITDAHAGTSRSRTALDPLSGRPFAVSVPLLRCYRTHACNSLIGIARSRCHRATQPVPPMRPGNALPGEPLYGVKVNLERADQGCFLLHPLRLQANWSAQLYQRAVFRKPSSLRSKANSLLRLPHQRSRAGARPSAAENFDANVAQLCHFIRVTSLLPQTSNPIWKRPSLPTRKS